MFSISSSIASIKDAEAVAVSPILTSDEQLILLTALKDGIPFIDGSPAHSKIAISVIERLINERQPSNRPEAKKQRRKAGRVENTARVDQEGTEEPTEEAEGETEGVNDEAEDGRGTDPTRDEGRDSLSEA